MIFRAEPVRHIVERQAVLARRIEQIEVGRHGKDGRRRQLQQLKAEGILVTLRAGERLLVVRIADTERDPQLVRDDVDIVVHEGGVGLGRSEEHTSELQSLMRISYAVFCLKKKQKDNIKLYDNIMKRIKNDRKKEIQITH